MAMQTISEHASFGGTQGFYQHPSRAIGLPMKFSAYMPPQAKLGKVPALFYLAGLTCNEETFPIKAGAQKFAAEHGIMLIAPDTSPRKTGIEGAIADWDFGEGAGFYLDATAAPWSKNFRMESYIVEELRELIIANFAVDQDRLGIFGHSMGGHGALTLALRTRHRDIFKSVSAFAPIAAPMKCAWGEKAFSRYLGDDKTAWAKHDASMLMREMKTPFPHGILIDQGLHDKFLADQLNPQEFEAACQLANQPLQLDRHAGYDHGYYFIASFIEKHIAFHARALKNAS